MFKYIILKEKNKKNTFFYNYFNNNEYENKDDEKYKNSIFINTKFIYILLILIIIVLPNYNFINNIRMYSDETEDDENINKENIPNTNYFKYFNYAIVKNQMHYYKLYNIFKIPQISIVISDKDIHRKKIKLIINQIKNLTNQNFSNLEIVLCIDRKEKNDLKQIQNEFSNSLKNKVLKIYEIKNNITKEYADIINKLNGVYTIFLNNIDCLENINMYSIITYTYGRIDNNFEFTISNGTNIYLLKTKCLKNLVDDGEEFNRFDILLNNIKSIPPPILNYIHISLCPDNNFTTLTYVTMTSILSSKSISSYICFYLIVPSNFENKNVIFLNSLHENYEYFNITYIKMDNRYDKCYTDKRITKQAYYRFSLGELLPNLNKIIYLDSDIIVYKDLLNFYNINFEGKLILGQPTYGNIKKDKFSRHEINTGILLLNLVEMRNTKFEGKILDIISKGKKLKYHDQTLLNSNFKNYIGIFPPEYHTRPWSNYTEMKIFNRFSGKVYDDDYYYFSHKYPTMRHFLGRYKPKHRYINHIEDWWFFARKSKYYNDKADTYKSAFNR